MQTRVAIVGGGPVGLGLGVELGQRGIPTVVVETQESVHRIPKGQNLTQRTMEHFRFWGIEDDVREARVMPPDYPAAGVNAYGDLASRYAHPWFKRSQVDQYYFATNERLPQYLTEEILRHRLSQLPAVTTLYGTTAQSVSQDDDHAVVVTDDDVLEADYVVGCDGAHSMVREQAGIAEHRSDHDRKMVLLVFRSKELHDILEERFGEASFFNVLHPDLDGYWRFLGRVDVGEGWFFHAPVPTDASLDDFDYEELLFATVGAEFGVELDYIGFWDLRIAVADTYQSRRLLIAGDAAHSHPPYGGYGINTGLEDARNLGWKLAAVMGSWGGERLLGSYTVERKPVFASTARDFIEGFIDNDRAFIAEHDPALDEPGFAAAWERRRSKASERGVSDFEPHYEGSPIVFGPPGGESSAVGKHSFEARPGHHLPPSGPGAGGDLFERLGAGFALITADPGDFAVAAFASSAEKLGVPLTVVFADDGSGMADYGSQLILVRPDHFVSWVDDGSPHDPNGVLSRSVGR